MRRNFKQVIINAKKKNLDLQSKSPYFIVILQSNYLLYIISDRKLVSESSRAILTRVQPLRYKLNGTLLYFLQIFDSKQLVWLETKTQHLAGETADLLLLCASAWLTLCPWNGVEVSAFGVHREEMCHKSLLPPTCWGQGSHQLRVIKSMTEALILGSLSMKPLERTREGTRQSIVEGWQCGGEAQLAAASNWPEQVSMAGQTHMRCGF